MQWSTYLLGFFSPAAGETVAPVSGSEIWQIVLGAFNLGAVGWMCWVFFTGKLHSDSEMERARTDLAGAVESARSELARSVEAARADLLRENQRILGERDAALAASQQLVPLLSSFVATSQSLIPLLQELVRNREAWPVDRRRERE